MKKTDQYSSRRGFLKYWAGAAVAFSGGLAFMTGCISKEHKAAEKTAGSTADPCDDALLGKDDVKARESMGYVKKSPLSGKHCGNCKLFLPVPANKDCGRCQLFKGPVLVTGGCAYWAPQS